MLKNCLCVIAIFLIFVEAQARPQRWPNYAVEDGAPVPDARDWDSDAFAKVENDTAGAPAEDNIEKEALGLERAIFENAGQDLKAVENTAAEVETRAELYTFAKDESRNFFPKGKVEPVKTQATGVKGPEAEVTDPPNMSLMLKAEKQILPQRPLMKLTDEELRKLCLDLRGASHLTIDAAVGSSLQNFTQKNPILLKLDRMNRIENMNASFVAIVANDARSRLQTLKRIRRPHLVCGVQLTHVNGIDNPLIIVGPRVPSQVQGHPKVRFIKTSAATLN